MLRLFALVALLCTAPLTAATITVTDLNDDTLANLAGDSQISLREAIEAANTDTSVDGSTAGSGADVIVFATSVNGTLTTDIEDLVKSFGPTAFVINSDITIDAAVNGNTIELQIAGTVVRLRHFGVMPSATLTLRGLTLSGGISRGGKGGDAGPGSAGGGGAGMGGSVFNCGVLLVESCTFSGNTARGGDAGTVSGAAGQAGSGGGGSIGGDGGSQVNTNAGGGGAGVAGDGEDTNSGTPYLGGANENGAQAGAETDGTAGGGGGGGTGFGQPGGNGTALSAAGLGGGGGGGIPAGNGGFGAGAGGTTGPTGGQAGFGGGAGDRTGGAQTGLAGYGGGGLGVGNGGGAGMGGAIFNHGGDVTITGCTFSGNQAIGGNASVPVAARFGQGLGGALFSRNGTVSIDATSTVSSNSATTDGDDFFVVGDGATATLTIQAVVPFNAASDAINGGAANVSTPALDDSYSTGEDILLNVGAAIGVLANDPIVSTFPSATVQTGTVATSAGGTATLNSDGSFTYSPLLNYVGTDSFTYSVFDGASQIAGATVVIDVINPSNDGPSITAPQYQQPDAAGLVVFSAANSNLISIADIDAGTSPIQVILTVVNGTLQLATTTGLTVVFGADGSSFIVFTGTLTNVNAALNGLMLTLPVGETGTLSILVDDLGNTGTGGPLTASANVTLAAKPSSDGGDDDETCSSGTGTGFAWLALLGLVGVLAVRLRRA
ncbi:MAG: cadherin-like domain-containing protein [Planctomycetes bacterium]|nr:cadherin-like domain-containing protein [Planctomycetota bacterium]